MTNAYLYEGSVLFASLAYCRGSSKGQQDSGRVLTKILMTKNQARHLYPHPPVRGYITILLSLAPRIFTSVSQFRDPLHVLSDYIVQVSLGLAFIQHI